MSESKRIACDVSPDFYKRFRVLKVQSGSKNNAEFLNRLLNLYEVSTTQDLALTKKK